LELEMSLQQQHRRQVPPKGHIEACFAFCFAFLGVKKYVLKITNLSIIS
jgi:hypothetical protein